MLKGDGPLRRLCHSRSGQNLLQFAGADDRVYFRDVLKNLVVKALN